MGKTTEIVKILLITEIAKKIRMRETTEITKNLLSARKSC